MPTDRAAYERELERGVRIFGVMRRSEHDLLREAANNVMAVYLQAGPMQRGAVSITEQRNVWERIRG